MLESEMLVNFNRCLEPILKNEMKTLDLYKICKVLNIIISATDWLHHKTSLVHRKIGQQKNA